MTNITTISNISKKIFQYASLVYCNEILRKGRSFCYSAVGHEVAYCQNLFYYVKFL